MVSGFDLSELNQVIYALAVYFLYPVLQEVLTVYYALMISHVRNLIILTCAHTHIQHKHTYIQGRR